MSSFDWQCLPAHSIPESQLLEWQVEAKKIFTRRYARQDIAETNMVIFKAPNSISLLMLSEEHEWITAYKHQPESFHSSDFFHFHVEKKKDGKEIVLQKGTVLASLTDKHNHRIDIRVPFKCVLHEINTEYFSNLIARKCEQPDYEYLAILFPLNETKRTLLQAQMPELGNASIAHSNVNESSLQDHV